MPQGDVLSGTLAAFTAWTVNSKDGGAAAAEQTGLSPLLLAAYGATGTVRHASQASLCSTDPAHDWSLCKQPPSSFDTTCSLQYAVVAASTRFDTDPVHFWSFSAVR